MSSAPTPSAASSPAPQPVPSAPSIVRRAPEKPRRTGVWLILFLLIAGGVALYLKTRAGKSAPDKNAPAVTRTAPIVVGDVRRTIRVSGTIQAERFSSIMAPQLRGSRSDRYRSYSSSSSSSTTTVATPSSTTSSATTPSAGSSSTTSSPTATSNTPSSSIGATRGTTNRFSDMSGSSTKGGDVSSRATSSSSVTSSDLGSTSSSLRNFSSGGGGPSSDFNLVLLNCAPAGSHVKAGDVVAEFDRQYQLLRLDDYRASVAQHEANIVKLKADQGVTRYAQNQLVASAKA